MYLLPVFPTHSSLLPEFSSRLLWRQSTYLHTTHLTSLIPHKLEPPAEGAVVEYT